jgi:DNA-binding CsgD family transcriptional regulator
MIGDPGDMIVCHHCDNPSCVNPQHLFLGTIQDNMDDRNAKGRQARGERNAPSKLTEAQVLAIRADSRTNREVALQYGVQENTVSNIRLRKTWQHVAPADTDCDPVIWLEAVRATHVRGEKAGRAKLTESDVREIRASKDGCTKLARKYGVSERSILDITNRKSWKHVS